MCRPPLVSSSIARRDCTPMCDMRIEAMPG
jgi:hypothetical protein